jgi:hypothetical protein
MKEKIERYQKSIRQLKSENEELKSQKNNKQNITQN